MQFVVISQRAKASNSYSLKDLPGHGRFDIIVRCILAATRKLSSNSGNTIYTYFKGSDPHGWLTVPPEFVSDNDDEISLAAKLQSSWNALFTEGSLKLLMKNLPPPYLLLDEGGEILQEFDGTIILGAQQDLTEDDLANISVDRKISLGKRSLLASHAIVYVRQLNIV